ncbi:hypothetical protein C0Q70_05220 [Pomacea canaliculata]|uniref:ETS domain-containing protein n=1 Tax=Pomacea canaliculata TaxID=400727 RepID=A0A2T7PKM0_POMCA|nr:hypothetical protein C0Q70_05220 [Pomacea canaliculata]
MPKLGVTFLSESHDPWGRHVAVASRPATVKGRWGKPSCDAVSARFSTPRDCWAESSCQGVARTERLWEFILRLLGDSKHNPSLIEWVERNEGTFRLNNSKAVALMWGMRKNNAQMTYEKLSRALRYYYHRRILEPVLGKKLVYRFGPNASPVWGETCPYRRQRNR